MKFLLDVHTHTVASSHAYSSLQENIAVAKERGLLYYGVSDHGPMMPGGAHIFYFQNIRVIPRQINGVNVLRGAEVNIIDYEGNLDLDLETLDHMDYFIASAHVPLVRHGTVLENTMALTNAMKHRRVSIIGHPDDSRNPLDYTLLVKAAKEHSVLLEVNNSSLNPTGFRQNAKENLVEMLTLCVQHNVMVIVNSDAHFSDAVGDFSYAIQLLEEIQFPEELIINLQPEKFIKFIDSKR